MSKIYDMDDLVKALKNTTAALAVAIQFVPENEILLQKIRVTLAVAKEKLSEIEKLKATA
jgi:hypothetical protein